MRGTDIQPAFDPTLWVVYEDFSPKEFEDAVYLTCGPPPEGQSGVKHKTKRLDLPRSVLVHSARVLGTREHEWTHFRQYISTPLGLFSYRLCALKEHVTQEYFRTCAPLPSRLRQSFRDSSIGNSSPSDEATAYIAIWNIAEHLENMLWCKSCPLQSLVALWNAATTIIDQDTLSGEPYSMRCQLVTRRPLTEQAVPDGVFHFRDLAEGFALFRELRELTLHFGIKNALEFLEPKFRGENGAAARYINHKLGISMQHPLIGALQEVALLCFVDPLLCDSCEVLDWDEIHPGICFQRAVDALSQLRTLPDTFHDSYHFALDAYGITKSPHWMATIAKIRGLSASPEASQPLDLRTGEIPLRQYTSQGHFQMSMFLAALRLRCDCPDIYCYPQMHFPPNWNRFVDGTMPPLIVHPQGLSLPRARDDLSFAISSTMVMHAFGASVLDDMARNNDLRSAKRFLQTLRLYSPNAFPPESIRSYLHSLLGNGYDPDIHNFDDFAERT